jgi:hypothetical protein
MTLFAIVRAGPILSLSLSLSLSAPVPTLAATDAKPAAPTSQDMLITRAGTQPAGKGPPQNFTGSVRVDPLFAAHPPSPSPPPMSPSSRARARPGTPTRWDRRWW